MVSQIFDRNKDGQVSLKELKKVTEILGTILTKDEVDEFMKEADKVKILYKLHCKIVKVYLQDGDGTLDIDEFVKMLLQYG